MDKAYVVAMQQQLAELEEEIDQIAQAIAQQGHASRIVYRASERAIQLLVEACIGIAKQTLKARAQNVPVEPRQVFEKLRAEGLDDSGIPWGKVIGMRNAIVHDYLNLDRDRVLEIITQSHYKNLIAFGKARLQAASQ